uniref:Reverse transcriptase zinc-binding domain-containing protein n=1 Tax=Oryza glaberrima TaxID=4538 RepID=I1QUQ8_ORYGL
MVAGLGEGGRERSNGRRSRANNIVGTTFSLSVRRRRRAEVGEHGKRHGGGSEPDCRHLTAADHTRLLTRRRRHRRVAPCARAAPLGMECGGVVQAWTTSMSRRVTRVARTAEGAPPPPPAARSVSATHRPGSSASTTRRTGSSASAVGRLPAPPLPPAVWGAPLPLSRPLPGKLRLRRWSPSLPSSLPPAIYRQRSSKLRLLPPLPTRRQYWCRHASELLGLIDPFSGSWDEDLLQQIFWEEDVQVIKTIPVHVELEDTLAWHFDPRGCFSVRSAYKVQKEAERRSRRRGSAGSPNGENETGVFWRKLWKMGIPGKIKHFLWRLSHNSLAMRCNLKRRGWRWIPAAIGATSERGIMKVEFETDSLLLKSALQENSFNLSAMGGVILEIKNVISSRYRVSVGNNFFHTGKIDEFEKKRVERGCESAIILPLTTHSF